MIRLPRRILCVDWDKRSLRMVVARAGGGAMQLEDAHSHRIPHSVDVDDPQSMGAFITQMQRRHRWRHRRVIVDVSRDKAVLNRMTLPPTPLDELAGAVGFQALKELPFAPNEAVIDYVIMRKDDSGRATEVLLAAVRRETVDRLRETCQAAGLTPARIGLRPYANRVSLAHLPGMAEASVLFLDVGPTMTEIDVIAGGELAFSRAASVNLPPGGGALVTDSTGGALSGELADLELAGEAERVAVHELLVEITRTLQAYRATEAHAPVDRVVIGGSGGIEPHLARAVQQRFGLKTELFDPTGVLGAGPADAPKLRSFSAALGLAWGLTREGLLELDFLNPKKPVPHGQALRRRLRIAGLAAGVLLAAGASVYGKHIYTLRHELAAVRADIAPGSELARTARRQLDVLDMLDEVREWEQRDRMLAWPDHLLELTRLMIAPGKKMLVKQLLLDERQGAIKCDLLCCDHQVLTRFIQRINQVDDGRRYRATIAKSYREDPARGSQLHGQATLQVQLLEFQKHLSRDKARERQHKQRRRRVLAGQKIPGAGP